MQQSYRSHLSNFIIIFDFVTQSYIQIKELKPWRDTISQRNFNVEIKNLNKKHRSKIRVVVCIFQPRKIVIVITIL